MKGGFNPVRVQKFLRGLQYPARKQQVLHCARAHGADERVMALLDRLPDVAFASPISLSCEVGRQAEKG
jgi:hypothetical protein